MLEHWRSTSAAVALFFVRQPALLSQCAGHTVDHADPGGAQPSRLHQTNVEVVSLRRPQPTRSVSRVVQLADAHRAGPRDELSHESPLRSVLAEIEASSLIIGALSH